MNHTVEYVVDQGGVVPVFHCHDPLAECRWTCPLGCESFTITITAGEGSTLVSAEDEHGHPLERGECNFVEWMQADDDPFVSFNGPARMAQPGPIAVDYDPVLTVWQWTPASPTPHAHYWRLVEDGYSRTWIIRDASDESETVTPDTDFVIAYDSGFGLEEGSGDYWLECRECLQRVPYTGEVDWR